MTDQVDPETGFPSKGSLRRIPFPQLIRQIARSEVTGSLYLLQGQTKKVVFFRSGKPVSVRSNVISECLGQTLAQERVITQEQSDNSLEAVRRTGKKQGELLIEMGLISEGNLEYGLTAQFRTKLSDIFAWEEGRFQFKPGGADQGEIEPRESTEYIIITGIQERYSDERARNALRPFAAKYPVAKKPWTETAATLDLIPEEVYFLQCLDGSRTVDELLSRRHDPAVPRVSTILYGLIEAGIIDLSDRRMLARPAPAKPVLQPAKFDDAALAPDFEAASVIGEYEDTPLPSGLPSNPAAQSTSRLPALPSEDEEMFAGVAALDEDESVVLDTRDLRAGTARRGAGARAASPRAASPSPLSPLSPRSPSPRIARGPSLGDETDFSDMLNDEDDEPRTVEVSTLEDLADQSVHDLDEESFDDEVELLDEEEMVEVHSEDSLEVPAALVLEEIEAARPSPAAGATRSPLTPLPSPISAPAPIPAPTPPPTPAADLDEEDDDEPDLDDLDALADDLGDLGESGTFDAVAADASIAAAPIPAADLADDLEADLPELGDLGDLDALADDLGDLDASELELDDLDLGDLGDLDDLGDLGDLDDLGDLGDLDLGGDAAAEGGDDDDDDDEEIDEIDEPPALIEPAAPLPSASDSFAAEEIEDIDDLDDLGFDDEEDDFESEAIGEARYQEAQAAMSEGDYATSVALFEDAYRHGFDIPDLHAMLAFARFRAAGGNPAAGQSALELLDYAEQRDPELDIVHAYRGAVLLGLGAGDSAREAFERALELNPYCELAIEYINTM